jgi:hypothetical protein
MKKSAREKLYSGKEPRLVLLDRKFGGISAGKVMLVASPLIVDGYLRAISVGNCKTIAEMRNDLARAWNADSTCPLSTSVFLRIVAEAAIEELESGFEVEKVAPFWRVLSSGERLVKKLAFPPEMIDSLRRLEDIKG